LLLEIAPLFLAGFLEAALVGAVVCFVHMTIPTGGQKSLAAINAVAEHRTADVLAIQTE